MDYGPTWNVKAMNLINEKYRVEIKIVYFFI